MPATCVTHQNSESAFVWSHHPKKASSLPEGLIKYANEQTLFGVIVRLFSCFKFEQLFHSLNMTGRSASAYDVAAEEVHIRQ
jgi:hypothetical protein